MCSFNFSKLNRKPLSFGKNTVVKWKSCCVHLVKASRQASDGFPLDFVETRNGLWWSPDFSSDIMERLIHLGNVSTNAGWIVVKFGEDIHGVWKINPNDSGDRPPLNNQPQVQLFSHWLHLFTAHQIVPILDLCLLWDQILWGHFSRKGFASGQRRATGSLTTLFCIQSSNHDALFHSFICLFVQLLPVAC